MPATRNARPGTPDVTVPAQRPSAEPAVEATQPVAGVSTPPTTARPGFLGRRGVQLLLVGLVSLIVGIVIGSNATSSSANSTAVDSAAAATKQAAPKAAPKVTKTHAPAVNNTAPKAAAPAAPQPAATPTKPNDKGWVVQTLTMNKDFVGEFTGSARITNTNDAAKSASFTVTLFRNGHQIGVLEGVSDDVAAGKTVTVDLVSQDKFSPGSFTYDFQADFSF